MSRFLLIRSSTVSPNICYQSTIAQHRPQRNRHSKKRISLSISGYFRSLLRKSEKNVAYRIAADRYYAYLKTIALQLVRFTSHSSQGKFAMRIALIDLFVSALERVISTRSRHHLYGYEMRHINRIGKKICRRVAGKNVRAQKSFLHAVIYNALDSLIDGLDYLRFVESYPKYVDALAGDDFDRVCRILLDMERLLKWYSIVRKQYYVFNHTQSLRE